MRIAALWAGPAVLVTAFVGFMLVRWDGERIDAEADVDLQNRLAVVNAALQAPHTPNDQNDAWLVQLDGAGSVTPLGPSDTAPPVLAVARSTGDIGYAEQRVDAGGSVLVGALTVPDKTGQKHNLAVVTTIDLTTYEGLKSSRRTQIEVACVVASLIICALAFGVAMLAQRRRRTTTTTIAEPQPIPVAPPAHTRQKPVPARRVAAAKRQPEPEPRRTRRAARYGGASPHPHTGAPAAAHEPAPP